MINAKVCKRCANSAQKNIYKTNEKQTITDRSVVTKKIAKVPARLQPGGPARLNRRGRKKLQTLYPLYEGGGGVTLYKGDDLYGAAVGLDEGGANNFINGVVAAFYQHIGAQGMDEGLGGVFIEQGNGIYAQQGGCLEGAVLLVGNGAVEAF
ncbi:MAG: hypothetical protein K0Q79_3297 [Flavipsychrobacter sp.]|nr:hypothetical protein [Flavipsychrobacter sp.]